jgi:hypothetical protein
MPGLTLHVGASMQCTHAGTASTTPVQTRVLASGQPVDVASSVITVAGCPFQIPTPGGSKPQPCVRVQWLMLSTRVTVLGQPVLLQPQPGTGPGLCLSVEQIPQGPPTVTTLQTRVFAT